jgi:hypothetical protein
MATSTSARIRRVLKLVDELELEPEELRGLRAELDARGESVVNLDACKDESERALALVLKRRIDAAARGETSLVSMSEADKFLRDRRKGRLVTG